MNRDELRSLITKAGFAIVPNVLSPSRLNQLLPVLGEVNGAGQRGMLNVPAVAKLANSARLLDLARPHLSGEPRPISAIYFDKSPNSNWFVSWHQDLTIPVRARVEVPGFTRWSIKDGVPHVQPPAKLLNQMIAIRLHLDDCDAHNGALRMLLGSHRFGRLSNKQAQELQKECPEVVCRCAAGGALLIRPLVLHASSKSVVEAHRRVLHIEYAGFALPEPLDWSEAG